MRLTNFLSPDLRQRVACEEEIMGKKGGLTTVVPREASSHAYLTAKRGRNHPIGTTPFAYEMRRTSLGSCCPIIACAPCPVGR